MRLSRGRGTSKASNKWVIVWDRDVTQRSISNGIAFGRR